MVLLLGPTLLSLPFYWGRRRQGEPALRAMGSHCVGAAADYYMPDWSCQHCCLLPQHVHLITSASWSNLLCASFLGTLRHYEHMITSHFSCVSRGGVLCLCLCIDLLSWLPLGNF